jgi:two-component sensor histidine kinase/PAS domain-containing protein
MSVEELRAENAELLRRLDEAEETLHAIREGAVDAFVMENGNRVYTLEGADRPYRILVEQMEQGAAVLNAEGAILYSNLALAALLQVPHEKLVGRALQDFIEAAGRDAYLDMLGSTQARASHREFSLQCGDAPVPVHVTLAALSPDRKEYGVLITDLTVQKHHAALAIAHETLVKTEQRLRAEMLKQKELTAELAVRHKERTLLVDELNHRVKNTLATVQAIAAQTFNGCKADVNAREAFESRLIALSNAHNLLTEKHWAGAEIHDILWRVLEPHAGPERFRVQGPSTRLSPKGALAIAMGLHELATNAVKYGALSNDSGRVSITWSVDGPQPGTLLLQWKEVGGPPVKTPSRKGFGSRLIERGLAHDLNGRAEIEYRPGGVVCSVTSILD